MRDTLTLTYPDCKVKCRDWKVRGNNSEYYRDPTRTKSKAIIDDSVCLYCRCFANPFLGERKRFNRKIYKTDSSGVSSSQLCLPRSQWSASQSFWAQRQGGYNQHLGHLVSPVPAGNAFHAETVWKIQRWKFQHPRCKYRLYRTRSGSPFCANNESDLPCSVGFQRGYQDTLRVNWSTGKLHHRQRRNCCSENHRPNWLGHSTGFPIFRGSHKQGEIVTPDLVLPCLSLFWTYPILREMADRLRNSQGEYASCRSRDDWS